MGLGLSTPLPVSSENLPVWIRHQYLLRSKSTLRSLKPCTTAPRDTSWVRHEFCIQSHRHKPPKTGQLVVASAPLPRWVRNQFAGLQ